MSSVFIFFALFAFSSQLTRIESVEFSLAEDGGLPRAAKENSAALRKQSSVRPLAGDVRSYSGFLNVNPTYDAKLFYWFFECQQNAAKRPILVWLHGDPGKSSILPIFEENGPYKLVDDSKVVLRQHSWTKEFNLLYVDGMVGVGYSSTNSSAGYSKTIQQAAENLYVALLEFLAIFDEYERTSFYLAGEGYAAKLLLALALRVHRHNEAAKKKIKLEGISIGGGVIDPPKQQARSEYLYQMGIVDPTDKMSMRVHEQEAGKTMASGKYGKMKTHVDAIEARIKAAGFNPTVDVIEPNYDLSSYHKTAKYVQTKKLRNEIHVGDAKFEEKAARVTRRLDKKNWYASGSEDLANVLKNYKVLLYTGQFDLVVPTSQLDNVVNNLAWDYNAAFIASSRQQWCIDGSLIGYYKRYKNLRLLMMRKANHLIARSLPKEILKAVVTFL